MRMFFVYLSILFKILAITINNIRFYIFPYLKAIGISSSYFILLLNFNWSRINRVEKI